MHTSAATLDTDNCVSAAVCKAFCGRIPCFLGYRQNYCRDYNVHVAPLGHRRAAMIERKDEDITPEEGLTTKVNKG